MRLSQTLYQAAFAMAALLLTGCGSVVYKESAAGYVSAGRAAIKSVSDAATSLANAQDKLKATQVASDPMCPIAEQRVFLRSPELSKQLKMAMGMVPEAAVSSDCNKLLDCDSKPGQAACRNTCASAEEANCIANVERTLAMHLKTLQGSNADSFAMAVQPVANAISQAEYGRAKPVEAVLVRDNLAILTRYLDMLDQLTVKRESKIDEDAAKLSKRIENSTKRLSDLTGKQLSTKATETQTKVTSTITAMGKLAGDLKVMAQNANDASAIQKLVTEQGRDVESLVVSVKEIAGGDAMLGAVYSHLAMIQTRAELQKRYAKTGDANSRLLLLPERDKYAYVNGEETLQAVNALFDAMTKSHRELIRLVLDPSNQDKRALANAAFNEFKMIAEDVAGLIQIF